MKRIFLSYKFTGEDYKGLKQMLDTVQDRLRTDTYEVYSTIALQEFFKQNGLDTYDKQLDYCLDRLKESDIVLGIIKSEIPSNGMKEELELAKKEGLGYWLAIQEGLDYREYRVVADKVVTFNNLNNLYDTIHTLLD